METLSKFTLYFVAVGPQRTGSTWLHEVLEYHPSINLPSAIKETMYFDRYYHKGNSWLRSQFENSSDSRLSGEVGPSYFGSKDALERIKLDHPNCKIIISIRNPIEHAYSMYLHEHSKGRIKGTLSEVIIKNPDRLRTGSYDKWIPLWQSAFGKDNICLVWMDQIRTDPKMTHRSICEFLKVPTDHYPETLGVKKINTAKVTRFPRLTKFGMSVYQLLKEYRLHSIIKFCKRIRLDKITFGTGKIPKISAADYQTLADLYSAEVDFLEQLSGRSLSKWREQSTDLSGN